MFSDLFYNLYISLFQLAYVLDRKKDAKEDLLQLRPNQTLTRSDFWSLAFDELEATVIVYFNALGSCSQG